MEIELLRIYCVDFKDCSSCVAIQTKHYAMLWQSVGWPLTLAGLHKDDQSVLFFKTFFLIFSHPTLLQCEWLLGDRKPSPEDMDKGIDTDSPLFQAILENPVVQLGLTNPKTLLGKAWLI